MVRRKKGCTIIGELVARGLCRKTQLAKVRKKTRLGPLVETYYEYRVQCDEQREKVKRAKIPQFASVEKEKEDFLLTKLEEATAAIRMYSPYWRPMEDCCENPQHLERRSHGKFRAALNLITPYHLMTHEECWEYIEFQNQLANCVQEGGRFHVQVRMLPAPAT